MSVHRKIEKFLRATNMPPSTFGRLALRDPRLVRDLRQGRELREGTARKLERFLAEQAP